MLSLELQRCQRQFPRNLKRIQTKNGSAYVLLWKAAND